MIHTPGPWHTDPTKSFYVFGDFSLHEIRPVVANASTQANATLIAAAPELLKALEDLVFMVGAMRRPQVKAAKAAIARAKGEEVAP